MAVFVFLLLFFCLFYWFFCFIYLFIFLLLQEPGFPVCCVAVLYLNCSWFVCLFVLIFLLFPFSFFTWQQSLITGRQRNTWPWWWGIAQCLGGPRKRRCVKRSTLPGWPVWYLHQISPAVLPAPGFRQLLTDGGPSVLPARRSWRWTRSLSCSAAKSAAPWCCPSSPPPGKPFAARSKLTHPPGSWLQLAGGWGTSNPAWTLKLIMIVFSLLSVSGLVAMPQLHWIITS